uniref:Putative capsid protein n=1 Tax=Brassica rapa cryptic virus 1 TaxID=1768875 RepID=A0A0U3B2F0_9VIRU|nr:putative capsid protein [Brassica rapa cryptic virus 1]
MSHSIRVRRGMLTPSQQGDNSESTSPKTRVDSRTRSAQKAPVTARPLSRFQVALEKVVTVRKRVLKRKLSAEESSAIKTAVRKQISRSPSPPRPRSSRPAPDPLDRIPSPPPVLPSDQDSTTLNKAHETISALQFRIEVLQQNIFFLRRELASFSSDSDPFEKIVNYAVADLKAFGVFRVTDGRKPQLCLLTAMSEQANSHLFSYHDGVTTWISKNPSLCSGLAAFVNPLLDRVSHDCSNPKGTESCIRSLVPFSRCWNFDSVYNECT